MTDSHWTEQRFPFKLTQAQRKVVAKIVPELTQWLNLAEPNHRTIPITLAELTSIKELIRGTTRRR